MNQGWKGSVVGIDRCSIGQEGGKTVISVGVQFLSEDGTVHAVCNHSLLLDPEVQTDEVATSAVAFLQALKRRVEELHFAQPQSSVNTVLTGIAESLAREGDDPGIAQG